MLPKQLLLLCFAVATARAQKSGNNNNNNDQSVPATLSFSQSIVTVSAVPPSFTGSEYTYETYGSQITIDLSSSTSGNATATATGASGTQSGTGSQSSTKTSTSAKLTVIGGDSAQQTSTGNASSTSSSVQPTNTIPCNGYPEFCSRKYSNITQVAAHNSAFSIKNNAAANQWFDTEIQLNDGARMIQGETHWVNDTVYMCHTSCDLLNAGPWVNQLELIVNWVERHPYDVVTILVVNSDMRPVENYTSAIEASGILPYLFEPDVIPLRRDEWPTLSELILKGKRVVMFMDYMANQPKIPYILNEFIHMWETPFSPTDNNFPCTQQRPPNLNQTKAKDDFMYLANHNLNTAVNLGALTGGSMGQSILIPNFADLNTTNGQLNETGQAERMRLDCEQMWDRPPNFLLVDYYNYGDPEPGSVFEVAARANGVQYTRSCCGSTTSGASARLSAGLLGLSALVAGYLMSYVLW